jgi:cardiolipin synthase
MTSEIGVNLPNLLSLLRMAIIPFFVIAILNGTADHALALFALAGITDALDGFLARFFGQVSVLGSYLDPIADKLLLISAFVMLSIPSIFPGVQIPIAITVLVIARDVLIMVLALVLYLALDVSKFPPTLLSKINTVLQIVGVTMVLLSGLVKGIEQPTMICLYFVAAFTVLSGLDYIYRAHQMAETANKPPAVEEAEGS